MNILIFSPLGAVFKSFSFKHEKTVVIKVQYS